jgi:hypothetical protein
MRTLLTIFLGSMALWWSAEPARAEGSRTVFILDATAQMSAKLGQQRKIDAVKTAVAGAVSRLDPAASVSVWAIGTNPAKKCEDRGQLVPLQPASKAAAAISKALGPVEPRAARAPIFGTLQAALEALGENKDTAISAVLIAGTGDDCTGDICSEAARLHSAYPNAKLSVLGIGMSEQSAANFTCAAKAMGGGFTAVKSASELDKVLKQTLEIPANAKPLNATDQAPAAANTPTKAAEAGASAKQSDTAPGIAAEPGEKPAPADTEAIVVPQPPAPPPDANTVLSAVMGPGTPPLDAGVTWEIYKINTTPTGQLRIAESPSWIGGGGQARLKLAEGQYTAYATFGFAKGSGDFTIATGKTDTAINLGAGTIAAEALQTPGGQPASDVFFILYRRKGPTALEELGRSSETPAIFHVNAGEYVLSALAGIAKRDASIKVEAGKVSAVRMPLDMGILELNAFAAEGQSKPVPAWHSIYTAVPEAGKTPGPLLKIAGGSHRVQLPAGNYRVETVYGNVREVTTVSVSAGQTVTRNVVLNAGEAKISVPAGKPAPVCSVYANGQDRNAGPAARVAGVEMSLILKAGSYELECRANGDKSPPKQAQFLVAAGETRIAKIGE